MSVSPRLPRLLLLLMLFNSYSHAREAYLRDVPSPFGCTTCHQDPRMDRQGANIRNGFGFDYVAQRQDWASMCEIDSDGDGITNAVELLDPDCSWRPAPQNERNPPLPNGDATHPGDPDDPNQCGDGIIQGSESCDGDNLGDDTCASLGFLEGLLACSNSCRFNQTDCVPLPILDMSLIDTDSAVPDMRIPDAQSAIIDAFIESEDDAKVQAALRDAALEISDSSDSPHALLDLNVNEVADQNLQETTPSSAQSGCSQRPNTPPNVFVFCGVCLVALRRKRSRERTYE